VIIVSDTSPINNLAAINYLHLLHLYGTVLIPEAVYRELTDPNFHTPVIFNRWNGGL
jgi:uncharacterized protein